MKPTKIVAGLPALGCGRCDGFLLSMLSYRLWIERKPDLPPHTAKVEALEDTARTLVCPKCRKLMTKYRIATGQPNRLDSCGHCGELWVDNGEWELLLSLGLAAKVSSILSEPWQSELRQQQSRAAQEARLEQLLGVEDYGRLREFSEWAASHPRREELMNFLFRHDR